MTSETKSADGSSTKADASSIPHFDLRSWVVAGDVLNGEKAAAQVLKRLKNQKYNAVGLNPRLTEDAETKLGIPVKRSFADAANALKTVDVLNLCINSKSGIEILRDAHKKGVQYVFIQPGTWFASPSLSSDRAECAA